MGPWLLSFTRPKSLRDSIPKNGLNPAQFFPWTLCIADRMAISMASRSS